MLNRHLTVAEDKRQKGSGKISSAALHTWRTDFLFSDLIPSKVKHINIKTGVELTYRLLIAAGG